MSDRKFALPSVRGTLYISSSKCCSTKLYAFCLRGDGERRRRTGDRRRVGGERCRGVGERRRGVGRPWLYETERGDSNGGPRDPLLDLVRARLASLLPSTSSSLSTIFFIPVSNAPMHSSLPLGGVSITGERWPWNMELPVLTDAMSISWDRSSESSSYEDSGLLSALLWLLVIMTTRPKPPGRCIPQCKGLLVRKLIV